MTEESVFDGMSFEQRLEEVRSLRERMYTLERELRASAIREAQNRINAFKISCAELRFAAHAEPKPVPSSVIPVKGCLPDGSSWVRPVPAIVYRGPGGRTWTGIGERPTWVKDLEAMGGNIEDFRTGRSN